MWLLDRLDELERNIRDRDVELMILDPLPAHLTVSIYANQKVRIALTPLTELADQRRCAVVAVTHSIKSVKAKSDPIDAIGGAGEA